MALTGKKRAFADAVLAGSTNKEAAIAAGYSPATAAQSGSRMAKDPVISAYLVERRGVAPVQAAVAPPVAPPVAPKGDEPPGGADEQQYDDPEKFLMDQMNDPGLEMRMRIDVAKALMPFKHQKLGEGGKKEQRLGNAKAASQGKFAVPPPPPRLVHSGGK